MTLKKQNPTNGQLKTKLQFLKVLNINNILNRHTKYLTGAGGMLIQKTKQKILIHRVQTLKPTLHFFFLVFLQSSQQLSSYFQLCPHKQNTHSLTHTVFAKLISLSFLSVHGDTVLSNEPCTVHPPTTAKPSQSPPLSAWYVTL